MRVDLLNLLADRLEKDLPPEVGFDMNIFAGSDSACGSTACAIGHAALMPEFQDKGLRLHVNRWDPNTEILSVEQFNYLVAENARQGKISAFSVVYKDDNGMDYGFFAASRMFGIPCRHAEYLFGGIVRSAKQEATLLRDYVSTNGRNIPDVENFDV